MKYSVRSCLSLGYKALVLIFSIIAMVFVVLDTVEDLDSLVYYTNLSNIVVFFFFAVVIAFEFINLIKGTKLGMNKWFYTVKGAVVMCILITGLIYHFLLAEPQNPGFWNLSNLSKHYIVPILVLLDFLIFDSRCRYKWWSPLCNMILPYAYFIFAMIRGVIVGPEAKLQFCYGFIDITKYGVPTVAINVVVISLAVVAMSYLFYTLDQWPRISMLLKSRKAKRTN